MGFILGPAQAVGNRVTSVWINGLRAIDVRATLCCINANRKAQHCCQIQRAMLIGSLAIDDIGFARIIAVGVSPSRADNQIIITIPVDIPST